MIWYILFELTRVTLYIAVGGKECKITLCDIQTGSHTHSLRSHRQPVMSLAWSPHDEYLLASGSQDNRVVFWDIRKATGPLLDLDQHNGSGKGNVASSVTAHNGHVNGLCFSSDGLHLLSFGTDNRLRLWDTCTGRNTLVSMIFVRIWCRVKLTKLIEMK